MKTCEIETISVPVISKPVHWPKDAIQQVRAVADVLASISMPVDDVAPRFSSRGAWKKRLPQLLQMLVNLGHAQETNGHYSGIGK